MRSALRNSGVNADELWQVRKGRLARKVPILERCQVTCPQIPSRNCNYGIFYFLDVSAARGRSKFTNRRNFYTSC